MADDYTHPAVRQGRTGRRRIGLTRAAYAAAVGLLGLAVLTGCGSSGTSTGQPSARTAATDSNPSSTIPESAAMIHIKSFKYTVPDSVAPGATVSVMNMDRDNHTVTADAANAFDVQAPAGMTVTFTAPSTPGNYPFHCSIHPNMHAVLVVK